MRVLIQKDILDTIWRRDLDVYILGWGCFGYWTHTTQLRGDGSYILLLTDGGIMKLELKR